MATLFVVGTPIGNLGDITLRAIETLRAVGRIAAEDTRRTRALLSHLDIRGKALVALNAHADAARIDAFVESLLEDDGAFVTDAGMPTISDPGAALVRRARERGVHVTVVPGPSAPSAAAVLSGLVDGGYRFVGFLPRKGSSRKSALEALNASRDPVILFESSVRLRATLQDLARSSGDRAACVVRELTKKHEEAVHGTLAELAADEREWRGEITLVLGPASERNETANPEELERRAAELVQQGLSTKQAAARLADEAGISRRAAYALILGLSEG